MVIHAKYQGACKVCGKPVNVGDRVGYTPGERGVQCVVPCRPQPEAPSFAATETASFRATEAALDSCPF